MSVEPTEEFGYVCQRCGLSDVGWDRLMKLGFPATTCPDCRDHFKNREES